jgi:hypothetical protein
LSAFPCLLPELAVVGEVGVEMGDEGGVGHVT